MRNEYVEIHVNLSSYLCETCNDYITNVSSFIRIFDENNREVISENIYGDNHYGQLNWFSFFQPALDFFGVKVVSEDDVVDGDLLLRVNYRNVSSQYGLDLEINQKVIASFDLMEDEDLPQIMQKIFGYITKSANVFIIEDIIDDDYYDDDNNDYDQ